MKKVVVGSQNPVKVSATQQAFEAMFPEEQFEVVGVAAPSGVSDQPMTDEETKLGAYNRTVSAKNIEPKADFWVGIEGGLEKHSNEQWTMAWMCVSSNEQIGYGKTSAFLLPTEISNLINNGMELGHAADKVFSTDNIKQKGGAIGLLTNGLVSRRDFYLHAMIFALIPFLQKDLYN